MEMKLKDIKDKKLWEDFLSKCKEKTFLHSWNWGDFQEKMSEKVWRWGILKKEKLVALALVLKIKAKRANFFFIPHGPVILDENENFKEDLKREVLKTILDKLSQINKTEKCCFLRISPIFEKKRENIKIFEKLGFIPAPIHIHPEMTWELKIDVPESELLMGMRKTTRYLIKRAQREKNIKIKKSVDLKDLEKFYEIYQETAKRRHFIPFSFEYLKNEILSFQNDNQISIFLAKYSPDPLKEKEEIISGGIFIFWQKIAFYHHGASLPKYPKIPTSYLLLWSAIKEAKERGCEYFNFWGIAPREDAFHPWQGLTLFKTGFGGYKKEYVKTQDFPFSKKYWLIYIFETLRRYKRGL